MKISSFYLFLTLLLLTACDDNTDSTNDITDALLSKSAQAIVNANNTFAFDFIKEVHQAEEKENYMISPVSLSLALGMAYNGAEGSTKSAFEEVMYYQNIPEGANDFNKALIASLSSTDNGSIMEIANSLWINEHFPVKQEFIDLNTNYYSAEVQNRNFIDPNTLTAINQWVSDKTHEKIPSILSEISNEAVLYLINALYFNANWKFAFDEDYTDKGGFQTSTGSYKDVDVMKMTEKLPYQSNELFSSVQLPYESDKFSMTVLLPVRGKTTDDIIEAIDNNKWEEWQTSYDDSQEVTIYLPKFKSEYSNQLNDELIALGLGIAFDSDRADFSNISDIRTFISFVLQKTFIDVNESGTEAAAVTIIGFETTSIGDNKPQPIFFNVDHEFLYLITDKATGSICFMGKVGNPEYEE